MQCWGFSICCFIWLRELSITTGKGVLVQNSFVRVGYFLCLPGPALFVTLVVWRDNSRFPDQISGGVMGIESYGKRASAGGTDWALKIWLKPGITTSNSTPRPLQFKCLFVGYLLLQGAYVQGCPAPALGSSQAVCGSLQSRFVCLSQTKSCLCICVVITSWELVFFTQELCFWQGETNPSCLEPLSCGSGPWLCAGKSSVLRSLSDLSSCP